LWAVSKYGAKPARGLTATMAPPCSQIRSLTLQGMRERWLTNARLGGSSRG